MFRYILTSLLATASFAQFPIEENQYYKVYHLTDVDFEKLKSDTSDSKQGGFKSIVEYPYDGTIPRDNGGNFGDAEFPITLKNGTLIGRDTIVNEVTSQNLLVVYQRTFNGAYIEDFKVLNFGRQRGWVRRADIQHVDGFVGAHILIAAGNKVRIFAETYARI